MSAQSISAMPLAIPATAASDTTSHSLRAVPGRAEPVDDIEMSDRATPPDASNTVPESTPPRSKAQQRTEVHQFMSLCLCLFMSGWNDGSSGPLLPRIQEVYNIGFAIVSLTFVCAFIGFISGAFLNIYLIDKLGFGKILALGSILQAVAYVLQSTAPPFPVFVLAYAINGIGSAMQNAQANGYVATLQNHPKAKMSIMHAVYGAGALSAPIVATQFATFNQWSFYYLVSLSIACLNTVSLCAVFRLMNQDESLVRIGQALPEAGNNERSKFRQIFSQKAMYMIAIFIIVYEGLEVTIGGWIVTFIINVRGGGATSGYISAGFFGGLMVGRLALLWVNKKVGERRVLYLYMLIAVGFELVVWLVPSLIGNAVAVSIVGLVLGPLYPISMNHTSKILPQWLLTGSIGWIAGFGQAGTAVFPFVAGTMAQKTGIKSLQPLLVAMMTSLVVFWALIPNHSRRAD